MKERQFFNSFTHFSQKGKVKAKKISLRGPDVARGPYVAPSCVRYLISQKVTLKGHSLYFFSVSVTKPNDTWGREGA